MTEKAARDVGDDRHLAVARFVHDDARVPVHARDAFAVRRLVRIERHRHASDVERQPRCDRFDQLVNAVALEGRDAQRRRILLLQPASADRASGAIALFLLAVAVAALIAGRRSAPAVSAEAAL